MCEILERIFADVSSNDGLCAPQKRGDANYHSQSITPPERSDLYGEEYDQDYEYEPDDRFPNQTGASLPISNRFHEEKYCSSSVHDA